MRTILWEVSESPVAHRMTSFSSIPLNLTKSPEYNFLMKIISHIQTMEGGRKGVKGKKARLFHFDSTDRGHRDTPVYQNETNHSRTPLFMPPKSQPKPGLERTGRFQLQGSLCSLVLPCGIGRRGRESGSFFITQERIKGGSSAS
jgi:hypothetical protein